MSAPVLLFSAFGTLLIMGAPITLALALSAAVTYLYVGQELTTLVQIAFSSVNSFPIMALPAFVLAGALMECAGISRRIVTVAEHMVGQMSGGLAITAVRLRLFRRYFRFGPSHYRGRRHAHDPGNDSPWLQGGLRSSGCRHGRRYRDYYPSKHSYGHLWCNRSGINHKNVPWRSYSRVSVRFQSDRPSLLFLPRQGSGLWITFLFFA